MIRLEKSDFEEIKNVARLALIGNMKTEEFISRFKYLINDPPVKENIKASKPVKPEKK